MNYLKLGGKILRLEETEKLALTGNVEAAKRVGEYYGRKAKRNAEYYEKSISFFLICADAGCEHCIINVSNNALKYGKYLSSNRKNGDYKMYLGLAYEYAFKAYSKNNLRALGYLIRSILEIKKNDIKINIVY